jgi:ABC-type Mn2+/Zn2+ transport system permease subunit
MANPMILTDQEQFAIVASIIGIVSVMIGVLISYEIVAWVIKRMSD